MWHKKKNDTIDLTKYDLDELIDSFLTFNIQYYHGNYFPETSSQFIKRKFLEKIKQ